MELSGQISMMEICPEMYPDPELWECMETCEHVGERMDHFPTGGDRCCYGDQFNGTSGDQYYSEIDNRGMVHIYCRYYKRRGT